MLLALSGVTGIGKSYFKEKLVEELSFHKVSTIRTRPIRIGEKNGIDGIFITDDELDALKSQGKIIYDFNVFGGRYAYLKNEIFSSDNMVFEMHYTMIDDWKKIKPDIKTIYILPTDLEIPKQKTKQRNLSKEKEIERIKEIDEQYNKFISDKNFQSKFDYILYNNYDNESKKQILDLAKNLIINE